MGRPKMTYQRERPWWPRAECERYLGIGISSFSLLVERGEIGMMQIEGLPPRFSAADVKALAARSIRPAKAHAEAEVGRELAGV